MDADYYREYAQTERTHWWFQGRERILQDCVTTLLQSTEQPHILNVGTATGRTSEWLEELFAQKGQCEHLEYDEDCAAFARELTGLPIRQGTILDLPYPDNSFDLVCAFDVIEHVEDDALAVREMARVCKPGGKILISVPTFQWLWSEHDEINHHFRRYQLPELHDLFAKIPTPGKVQLESYFNTFLFIPIAAIRLLQRIRSKPKDSSQKPVSDFARDSRNPFSPWLKRLLQSERHLVSKRIRLPFGVSAILAWEKNHADT